MKPRGIIILGSILLLFALIHFASGNPEKEKKETPDSGNKVYVSVVEVENKMRNFHLESYGQLNAGQTLDIAFEVSGKVREGALRMRPGVRFNKGQLLYEIDAEEAKYALSARKSSYISLLVQVMPDIKMDYASESSIWDNFLNAIDINKPLPQLPEARSKKLNLLLNQRNIFAEYNNIKSQELRLEKHKYFAPFSGTVTDVFLEPGSIINPGVRIASALRTGDYELKIPIRMDDLAMYQQRGNVEVLDVSGRKVGVAKLSRISDVVNKMTQSLDVFFTIEPTSGMTLLNGMYVYIRLNRESYEEVMALPYLAVKNNSVRAVIDSAIVELPVEIVASFPDTLLVRGLKNKTQVLINSSEFIADSVKVVGIPK
jgi:multidrug efflux pump subunit AcrA (membrane-fusion protein)